MVDAAGAIYVIGGGTGTYTNFQDVWASTDGGARPDSVHGWWSGGTRGGTRGGNPGVLRGYYVVLRGSIGVLRSTRGGTTGVLRATTGVLDGY